MPHPLHSWNTCPLTLSDFRLLLSAVRRTCKLSFSPFTRSWGLLGEGLNKGIFCTDQEPWLKEAPQTKEVSPRNKENYEVRKPPGPQSRLLSFLSPSSLLLSPSYRPPPEEPTASDDDTTKLQVVQVPYLRTIRQKFRNPLTTSGGHAELVLITPLSFFLSCELWRGCKNRTTGWWTRWKSELARRN